MTDRFTVSAGGHTLECAWHGPHPEREPTIVLSVRRGPG